MKPLSDEFTAFIGIDWADRKHDICLQGAHGERREFARIEHKVDAIDQWAISMRQRFDGPIAVALELTKGPLVYALQKYDFFVLFPINPATLAKYREAFKPSRAKDDPTDAEHALELLMHHRDRLAALKPQSVPMRTLLHLVEQRRRVVDDKTRFTNRLGYALKQYFPQALDWFDHTDTIVFCDFLTRWPTLLQVKRARATSVRAFFRSHNVRYVNVIDERIQAIKLARPLTQDVAVITAYRLQALVLVDQLRVTLQAIDRFDAQIAEIAPTLPDYALFKSLPGAGTHLTPRLLVALGEQRERFATAAEIQKCSGVAPVTEHIGNTSAGSIGAGNARPSCGRPSSNGQRRRSTSRSGPARSIASNATRAARTRRPCAPWRSSGCASCTAAGRRERPTTSRPTSMP